jgi:hypothetical protein
MATVFPRKIVTTLSRRWFIFSVIFRNRQKLFFDGCRIAKAIMVCMHMIGTGGNGCTTMVCIINRKAACRKEREKDYQQLPVVVFWLPPPAVM